MIRSSRWRPIPLPERYGWGLHFDKAEKVALVAVESPEYRRFVSGRDQQLKVVAAMRSRLA